MKLVLISGLSGSGKSIALNVLEDAGYYCVDNLPVVLLPQLLHTLRASGYQRAAIAVDMRSGDGIANLPAQLQALDRQEIDLRLIFLDARDEVLIQRFSETRRRHPLATGNLTLPEAIGLEREALQAIAPLAHHIDTSRLRPNALRNVIKEVVGSDERHSLNLLFASFGFKHGLPLDADLVFDVRCLPNPYYDPALRRFTGKDAPVIEFLASQPEVVGMLADIGQFVERWLPAYIRDNRAYLTVAIGCTGGHHRSVYLVEQLARQFRDRARVMTRHRELLD